MVSSRSALVQALSAHARPSTSIGVALLTSDILQYAFSLAGVLYFAPMMAKFACGIFAGIKLGNLLILAHDAAHGCLVRGKRLNKLLAILAFVACLHNYRLWLIDHHGLHHPKTNGGHKGTYTPFSHAAYLQLPEWRRLLERFYRSGNPLGLAVHYCLERWHHSLFVPSKTICKRRRDWVSAWRYASLIIVYLFAWLIALVFAPKYSDTSAAAALVFGFAVPLSVFHFLVGFVEFAQHTHPSVGWFRRAADKPRFPPELVSVHLRTPRWLGVLMHNVLDHPVHHVHPLVPCYRLRGAQQQLNEVLGAAAVIDRLSLGWYMNTMRACKLYDFGNQQWLDFRGEPTCRMLHRQYGPAQSIVVAPREPCRFHDRRVASLSHSGPKA